MSSPPVPLGAILAAAAASSTTSPHSSTTSIASTSTSTTTSASPANTSPFFPEPSTLHPLPDPQEANRRLARNIVGYLVLALVLLIILFLLLQRFIRLRRTNQPLARFFHVTRSRPGPRPSSATIYASSQSTLTLPTPSHPRPRLAGPHHDLDYDTTYQNPSVFDDVRYPITASEHLSRDLRHIPLSNYPYMHYSGSRRTRAAGVDEQGRRLDSGRDPDQCSVDDKDMLPAYDRHGGPPKYLDSEMG